MPGVRTRARRRRLLKSYGPKRQRYVNMGPEEEDGVSGWMFPRSRMIRQRGVWVSADYNDGSRDLPADY